MRKFIAPFTRFVMVAVFAIITSAHARSAMFLDPSEVGASHPGVITIGDTPGGMIDDFQFFFDTIRKSKVPVRVEGLCVSACTLVFSLPHEQVCVTDTASFGFHLASSDGEHGDPNLTAAMRRRFYPVALNTYIDGYTKLHGELTLRVIYVSAATITKLGIFDFCKD